MNFSSIFFLLLVGIFAFVNCAEDLNQQADLKSVEQRTSQDHRFARGQAKRSWSMSRNGFGGGWGSPFGGFGNGFGGYGGGYGYGFGK